MTKEFKSTNVTICFNKSLLISLGLSFLHLYIEEIKVKHL